MQGADWHLRIGQREARETLEVISTHPLADQLLDLDKIRAAIDHWPTGKWNSYAVFRKYRDGLVGALTTGIFLTGFEEICGRS